MLFLGLPVHERFLSVKALDDIDIIFVAESETREV